MTGTRWRRPRRCRSPAQRRVFAAIARHGRAAAWQLAAALGEPEADVRTALDALWLRRLIVRHDDTYMPATELT